jgi:acetyl-CoA carboxylase biotin carboxyl carrier protein
MASEILVAHIEAREAEQDVVVRAPAVGVADGVPDIGVYVNPSQRVLTLSIVGERHVVQLPRHVRGRVVEHYIENTQTPVAYHQALFRISSGREADEGAAENGKNGRGAGGTNAELLRVVSPSEGVFYRRPSPDSPPYVAEGEEIDLGHVVGLVEVMKCFNQIRYGGPGMPERCTVVKVLVDDGTEVGFGQALLMVKPA